MSTLDEALSDGIVATHESLCFDCEQMIHEGDPIILASSVGWVHQVCPEHKPRPVCNDCFTEIALNGACACV